MIGQPVAVVTGAGGLIGSYLIRAAPTYGSKWSVKGLTRHDLDLTDRAALCQTWERLHPELVIHCAAVSKPQHCYAAPALARRVNVEATAWIVDLCSDIPLIFFSSDQVFDGEHSPYDEAAPVNPITLYAETKVEGERMVLANPRHSVVRTSLNGGISPTRDRAFNEEIRHAWEQGQSLKLFTDEFRCPIPAAVTARAIWELADTARPGLYHLAGRERLSRWQVGELLAARWSHITPRMERSSCRDFPDFPRQPDLTLNCDKLQQHISFPLPCFSEWLKANPQEPL